MKIKLEIIRAANGVTDKPWTRLTGYDLSSGKLCETMAMDALGAAALRVVEGMLHDGEELSQRKPVIEFEGRWQTKASDKGRTRETFWYTSFEVVTGPKMELARTKQNAALALDQVDAAYKAGNLEQAYYRLEAFVSMVAGRDAPSVKYGLTDALDLGAQAGHEEAAAARFSRLDRARGDVPAQVADAAMSPDEPSVSASQAARDYAAAKDGLGPEDGIASPDASSTSDASGPDFVTDAPLAETSSVSDAAASEPSPGPTPEPEVAELSSVPANDGEPTVEAASTDGAVVQDVAEEGVSQAVETAPEVKTEDPAEVSSAEPATVSEVTEAPKPAAVNPPARPTTRPAPPTRMAPPPRQVPPARPAVAPTTARVATAAPPAPARVDPAAAAAPKASQPSAPLPPRPRPSPMMRVVPGRVPARAPVPVEPESAPEPGMKM